MPVVSPPSEAALTEWWLNYFIFFGGNYEGIVIVRYEFYPKSYTVIEKCINNQLAFVNSIVKSCVYCYCNHKN